MPTTALADGNKQLSIIDEKEDIEKDIDYGLPTEDNIGSCMTIDDPSYSYETDSKKQIQEDNPQRLIFDPDEPIDEEIELNAINDSIRNGTSTSYGNLHQFISRSELLQICESSSVYFTNDSEFNPIMQGACNDESYYYFAYTIYRGKYTNGVVATRLIVCCDITESSGAYSVSIICSRCSADNVQLDNLSHLNDMTYNGLTHNIVISCGDNDQQKIYEVSRDYLNGTIEANATGYVFQEHMLSCKISCITYCENLNAYLVGVSNRYNYLCVLNSDFYIVRSNSNSAEYGNMNNSGLTAGVQGIACDETYIYVLCYKNESIDTNEQVQNIIKVFNWELNLVKEINLNITRSGFYNTDNNFKYDSYEGENLTFYKGRVLLGFNILFGKTGMSARLRHSYIYDLSSNFFSIQYLPDNNVSNPSPSAYYQNVFYNFDTKTTKNHFTKNGYNFKGWNVYRRESNKWYYENTTTQDKGWYVEGTQPSGYTKILYSNKRTVSHTVPEGWHCVFCAVWETTNKFYVSFDSNGGSGTMSPMEVTFGTEKKITKNVFTKTGEIFLGWNIYCIETDKWSYKNPSTGAYEWYREGDAPEGYMKSVYNDEATISQTVRPGKHITMFAFWNEFVVLYDLKNGDIIYSYIKPPTVVIYGTDTIIQKAKQRVGTTYESCQGYRQHRLELNKWRFQNKTNSSNTPWYKLSEVNWTNYKYYKFTGSTIKYTVQPGEQVVFEAQW